MKIAIIHDWLVRNVGGEKVLKHLNEIYPNADIYTLVDFLTDQDRFEILNGKKTCISFIQKLPFAKKHYQKYLPLFPIAIEQFDLSRYDIVISSSHAVAKGVLTNSNQIHICYCHTPIRYAWDLYHQYINESRLDSGLKAIIAKYFLHKIRMWDIISTNRVDFFIANSKYISNRIKKIYGRNSTVIYPPVDTDFFDLTDEKDDFYLCVSRLEPYKKVDIIVDAFKEMLDKRLIIIGNGSLEHKIKKELTDNIIFLDFQDINTLKNYMQKAKAFVYAAEEDFGITLVEAQACGTPVIAYASGGASETVIDGLTGILFDKQYPEYIKKSVEKFELMAFDKHTIRNNAKKFSTEKFKSGIKSYVEKTMNDCNTI